MDVERRETPQSFEVTEASVQDAERLAQIQAESWIATYPNAEIRLTEEDVRKKFENAEKRIARWRERLEKPAERAQVFVIKEGKRVVGYCAVEKGETENHVDALYLDPSFRGKHAGSTVFRESLAWLGENKPVALEVASYNDRAIDFYKRFGFEDIGDGEPILVIDDKFLPITNMCRPSKQ
ncbi:MAG: GNAT family N-acetyltransferase [Candidatus Uhrbacteria bacterium]|nr:GNAT family N-acetyltransferase [Candidatus Uhrbacteria bacterium]